MYIQQIKPTDERLIMKNVYIFFFLTTEMEGIKGESFLSRFQTHSVATLKKSKPKTIVAQQRTLSHGVSSTMRLLLSYSLS